MHLVNARPTRRGVLRTALAVGGAGGLATLIDACGVQPKPASAKTATRTSIGLQLDFLPLGRYAPYYYGVEKGIYSKRGLDVTIASSTGTGPALQQLVAGRQQMLFVDIPSMLDLMGKDPKPRMRSYAVVYATAPETVFFYEGGSIRNPKDLEGKTIATSAGSTDFELFPLFAKANGIDMSTISWKTVSASTKLSLMLEGEVDATTTYVMGLPGAQAGAKSGKKVGHFTYGDYGVKVYGNGLITTTEFASAHPPAVSAFVQASLEAYRQAFAKPQAAVEAMAKSVPTLDQDQAMAEVAIVRSLAMGPAQRAHGLGYQDPTVMHTSYEAVVKTLKQPIGRPVTDYYTNSAI
ncbi:MAG TPA: ABC transporter substrate-binding protein [Candidatus Dormibacteraeota bacterium]|jgi:NitT/TauT family transport system substrate-binding protein|nr:ABC transporter substrate-binding protein [Candidatus Dormibacteraeota bacterium]